MWLLSQSKVNNNKEQKYKKEKIERKATSRYYLGQVRPTQMPSIYVFVTF